MSPRSLLVPVVATSLLVVALAAGSSPAAQSGTKPGALDLLASAHPTGPRPHVVDRAWSEDSVSTWDVAADTAALTSATCDGCAGESTTLHVVYADRARAARLDNVADAWAQECTGCTATALSVQVVVLRGRPATVPNNRSIAVGAACTLCRTTALAFQVVLVAAEAEPLGPGELADLRAWFDEQAALVRASVAEPTGLPSPTAEPTPTDGSTPTDEPPPTDRPTQTVGPLPQTTTTTDRQARRDATAALDDLGDLLADALSARVVAADVDLSR